MESLGVDGLETLPFNPAVPVGDDRWGDICVELLPVDKDAVGIVGSGGSRGNASKPTDEVEVVLTGLLTTEEAIHILEFLEFCSDLGDQFADVCDVSLGNPEEFVLGVFKGSPLVDLEKPAVESFLVVVKFFEFGGFRGATGRDPFKGFLT